jgi:hypothetical protein
MPQANTTTDSLSGLARRTALIVIIAAAGKVFLEEPYMKDRLGGEWSPKE